MKIIFVLHSHGAGGAERHLLQLMQGLSASGIECIYAGPLDGWLGQQLQTAGFLCKQISFTGFLDLLSLWRLVRLIRHEHADIVHGHLTRGAYYSGLAAKFSRAVNIATAHSTNAGKWFGRARYIIAVSDAVNRFLVSCGYPANRIRTVHHGVPDYTTLPRPSRETMHAELKLENKSANKQENKLDSAPVLAMVARFMPAKGQDVALRALATMQQKQWTLVLAGSLETPYAIEMQALAEQLDIADRVRFIGHRDDVHNIYACADILLAPSRREALSLTLLEASAFSLPIVATDVGGIGEAVADGETGLLVPSEDTAALAHAIGTLLDNPNLRQQMGHNARRRYEQLFTLQGMTDRTIAVYNDGLSAGG